MFKKLSYNKSLFWIVLSCFLGAIAVWYFLLIYESPQKVIDRKELAILDDQIAAILINSKEIDFGFISDDGETFTLQSKSKHLSERSAVSYKQTFKPCTDSLNELNQPFFRFSRIQSRLIVDSISSIREIRKEKAMELVKLCSKSFNSVIRKIEIETSDNMKSWAKN